MKKSFTLIELLIVIAILGILAVGILVALDPIEQTRRATDGTYLQSAGEIKDAITRYYASKLFFPWCDPTTSTGGICNYAAGTTGCTADATTNFGTANTCAAYVLTQLTTAGELRTNPANNILLALNLVSGTSGTTFKVSYIPTSKSMKSQCATALGQPGVYTTTSCTAIGTCTGAAPSCTLTSNTCAYCIQ